jgi:hypothetical protein
MGNLVVVVLLMLLLLFIVVVGDAADKNDKLHSDDDGIDLTPLGLPSVAQGHMFAAQADEFMERGAF